MNDYVTLLGAEQVSNAASSMRESARMMQQAAGEINWAIDRLRQVLEEDRDSRKGVDFD